MLKTIKTNINNCKRGYEPLDVMIADANDSSMFFVCNNGFHNLMSNDEVLLDRIDGQRIKFSQVQAVDDIISDTEFTVGNLTRLPISPSSYEIVSFNNRSVGNPESGETQYIKFSFSEENKHIFCINRDAVENKGIRTYYYWDEETSGYTNIGNQGDINLEAIGYKYVDTGSVLITIRQDNTRIVTTTIDNINIGDVIYIKNLNEEYVEYTVLHIDRGNTRSEYQLDKGVINTAAGGEILKRQEVYVNKNFCEGDYVLYDGTFLKQIETGNTESEILNINNVTLFVYPDTTKTLVNCIVPVNTNGYDDRYELLIPFEGNEWFTNEIETTYQTVSLYCDDTRFWSDSDNLFLGGWVLKDGVTINKITGDLEVDFSIGENFAIDLLQRENFLSYAEEVAGSSVNNIINYERYPYTPMYYSGPTPSYGENETIIDYFNKNSDTLDGYLKPVKKISFKLNFRVKESTTEDNYNYDYGSWTTNDALYWNNYTIREDGQRLEATHENLATITNVADLLGYLGFTDDDIFYQTEALKKSFLRLSFYDSPNRETQKLLFYSTVYFDTNELYKKYCNILAYKENSGTEKKKMFVYDTDKNIVQSGNLLDATLSCSDKYNDDASADGFYLHLFDKMVEGNTCSMVYMKAEFNNAKFGKTIPLTIPKYLRSNDPILATDESFPRDYFYEESQTVNMGQLLSDMYVKVMLKFDYKTNNYVWFFPVKKSGEEIILTFFEPRVTGYDAYSYQSDIGSGYGTEDGAPTWLSLDNNEHFDENGIYVDEDGNPEETSVHTSDYALYTTAVTLSTDSLLKGTKLFNYCVAKSIKSIWIDGIRVKEEIVSSTDGAKVTNFQLPDENFVIHIDGYNDYEYTGVTTQDVWKSTFDNETKEYNDRFEYSEISKPQKIHRVNYYFFGDQITQDNTELYDELYKGTLNGSSRKKKTIECTEDVVNTIKPSNVTSGTTLPRAMFENIDSIRNVYFKKGIQTVGNGAFNNCQGLLTVDNDKDNGVICIGKNAFAGSKSLKEVYLPGVKNILKQAFQGCYYLTNVYFDRNRDSQTQITPQLLYIGCASFGYTNVRKIEIPECIKRIGNSAFRRCYHLTNFTIPANSTNYTVGKHVFTDNAIMKYVLKKQSSETGYYTYYSDVLPPTIVDLSDKQITCTYYSSENDGFKSVSIENNAPTIYQYRDSQYREYANDSGPNVLSFWRKCRAWK